MVYFLLLLLRLSFTVQNYICDTLDSKGSSGVIASNVKINNMLQYLGAHNFGLKVHYHEKSF